MGFTACQKEIQEEVPVNEGTVQVTFVSGTPETKTTVDTSSEEGPVFSWDENETFAVLEQTDALAAATSVTYAKVDGKAHITAEFAANAGKSEYKYATIYPASGYVNATGLDEVTLSLPAVQTMAEGSYDPDADLMVSEVVTANVQPTEAQMVRFTRMAAVVKMSLKNLTLAEGDEVEQVVFTADGKTLAGTITADLAAPNGFAAAEGSSSVTVNTSSTDVYFTVLPTTLEAGDAYTVVVITNKKLYIKKGTIPADKTLDFKKGMVTRFGVNMQGIAPSDKWVLVRDASTLKEGDVVAIVAKDYDKALSTKLYSNASETSTSAKRGLADITKIDNYLIGGEDLQQLTLVTGTVDGTFSFYDEARGKFLVSSSTSSTYLVNQVYCDVNTSFKITIDGATTAATITNTEGAYKDNLLRYNSNGYFTSNQNESSVYKDVCIYRLEGTIGTIPVVDATVTVPDSDESVVIAEEGVTEPTAITEVVFNYVGDWTIAVASSESWLSPIYADGKLSYTAEANTGAERKTVVTITASLEGHESLTWTFNVLQKRAPQDISIADFVKLSKDENTTYRLTGKVVATATTSGTWKLSDEKGNIAQIKYLKTEDNGNPYLSASDVEVELGDVMTVTAVVTASNASSACGSSNYPSFYKGHYNVSATVTPAVVGYEGGDATVAVAVNAYYNAVAPSTIEATIEESDFAELTYAGGSTATVSLDENTGGSRDVDVTFTCGLATSTVTIAQQNHPSVKVGWFLVTDASELKSGDKVIIAANEGNNVLAVGSSTTSTTTLPSVTITKSGNEITGVSDSVTQFTLSEGLKENEFAFNFTKGTTGYYLCAPNTNEQLKIKSGDLVYYGSWTITIDDQTGAATISTIYGTTTPTPKEMRYNATSTKFITIKTGATDPKAPISLYKYYN